MPRQHTKVERGPECPAEMAEIRTILRCSDAETKGPIGRDGLAFAFNLEAVKR